MRDKSPVWVLEHNIIKGYQSVEGSRLYAKLKEFKEKGIVNPNIQVDCTNTNLKTFADLDSKSIWVSERYMNLLWSFIYSVFVIHEEAIQKKYADETFDGRVLFNTDLLCRARKLLEWSFSLVEKNSPWDMSLPNPDIDMPFSEGEKEYIKKTNALFVNAIVFLLYHETAHLSQRHVMIPRSPSKEDRGYSISQEKEADQLAFDMLLESGTNDSEEKVKCYSSIFALCANLFLAKSPSQIIQSTHPDIDDRLMHGISRCNLQSEEDLFYAHCLTCFCIQFYAEKNDINLEVGRYENSETALNATLEEFKLKIIECRYG